MKLGGVRLRSRHAMPRSAPVPAPGAPQEPLEYLPLLDPGREP
jgi:hypothetical protein